MNVVTQIIDYWLLTGLSWQVCLEILRCCSRESMLMKVSDIIMFIMNIMWRDFKQIRSSCFRDIQKSARSPHFEWSCTYTGGEKTG